MDSIKRGALIAYWLFCCSLISGNAQEKGEAHDEAVDFVSTKSLQVDSASKSREHEFASIIREVTSINNQRTTQGALSIYNGILKHYPEEDYPEIAYMYDQARLNLISRLVDLHDPNALDHVSTVKSNLLKRSLFNIIMPKLYRNGQGREAELLLKEEIAKAKASLGKDKNAEGNYFAYLKTYANLLFDMDRYEESLKLFDSIVERGYLLQGDKGVYAEVQVRNKMYTPAFKILEKLTKNGMTTVAQKEALKECWIQLGNAPDDFHSYLNNLSDTLYRKIEAKIANQKVDFPAPLFELKDIHGNAVSLATLKGKIVFLDFWATWCGPCVGSFPAMQRAVDGYKDNPHVVFLFINTSEKDSGEERHRAISTLLNDKGYRFQVLLDEKKANDYIVSGAYGVRGIPAKFVIDQSGTVRYALSGFNGGEDATVEEVRIMIDTLLK